MKTSILFYGFGLAGAMLLASCSTGSDTTRIPVSASASQAIAASHSHDTSVAGRLGAAVNAHRQSIGKSTLQRHAGLDQMAREHCEFMARNRGKFTVGSKNISHAGFDERAFRARKFMGMGAMAENVAGGVIHGDIPSEMTQAWVASKGHAYNLKQNWDVTGLAVVKASDGMVYAVQIFATKAQTGMGFGSHLRDF